MLVSPGCSTPTGIDTDDLGTPKLISISTPASHGLGSRVLRKYYASESDQERRAAARHSGKLEAIPLSPGSKSGRTKRKWSTVKVVIDENMAAAQAHAETHIDQALAFASLPASQKGPLPSRKKDTSLARDQTGSDSVKSELLHTAPTIFYNSPSWSVDEHFGIDGPVTHIRRPSTPPKLGELRPCGFRTISDSTTMSDPDTSTIAVHGRGFFTSQSEKQQVLEDSNLDCAEAYSSRPTPCPATTGSVTQAPLRVAVCRGFSDPDFQRHASMHDKDGRALGTTKYNCQRRSEQVKSTVDDPSGTFLAASNPIQHGTANAADPTNLPVDPVIFWTEKQDQKLMALKAENNSWSCIAKVLEKDQSDCRQRFKKIKPKNWKTIKKSSKSPVRKDRAKKKTTPSVFNEKLEDVPVSVSEAQECYAPSAWAPRWDDGVDCNVPWGGNNNDQGDRVTESVGWGTTTGPWGGNNNDRWGSLTDDWIKGGDTEVEGSQATKNTWASGGSLCDGCGHPADSLQCCSVEWPGVDVDDRPWVSENYCPSCGTQKPACPCEGCGHPSYRIAGFKPCAVTYWATIESGGKEIRIPIDGRDVSGPEKSIVSKGMPKVWMWIHEKGLGDKVGLQDAFDLARSMREEFWNESVDKAYQSFSNWR